MFSPPGLTLQECTESASHTGRGQAQPLGKEARPCHLENPWGWGWGATGAQQGQAGLLQGRAGLPGTGSGLWLATLSRRSQEPAPVPTHPPVAGGGPGASHLGSRLNTVPAFLLERVRGPCPHIPKSPQGLPSWAWLPLEMRCSLPPHVQPWPVLVDKGIQGQREMCPITVTKGLRPPFFSFVS